ncbi:type IV secretion protein Rhs, partial [Escherichia coli]
YRTTEPASRRFISRGASRHSSELKPPPVSWRKRSAAAWRIPFSSPAAKTVAVWCSRRCWCRCSTGWKVKSWLTG